MERPFREGLRCLATGRAELASAHFRDAFFSDPHRFAIIFRAGLTHLRAEEWEEAVAAMREALSLNPRYADLHNYLGVALAESGDILGGIAAFRESIRLNPRYSTARLNLAFALVREGETREAEDLLERLLSEDSANTSARSMLDQIRGSRVDTRRLEPKRNSKGPGK